MLFEDSLEFEPDFPTNNAELVPIKSWHDIKFSDLWIPSELLHNRLLPCKPNLDTYAFYHTLEKPSPVDDTFSVYFESNVADASLCSSAEELLDSLDEVPTNECHNGNFLNSYYTESSTASKSPAHSTIDLLEYLNFSDSETEDNYHDNIGDNALEKFLSNIDENTSSSNQKDDSDKLLKDSRENNYDKASHSASGGLVSNLDANDSNSYQIDYTDQVFNETQVNNYDKTSDHVSENLLSNVDEDVSNAIQEDDSDQVVDFPDIYLKPKEDFSDVPLKSKKKSKKEKKQNKIQKNIPLDNFFLGKHDSAYSENETDEFYENIMRRTFGADYIVDEAKQTENALLTIFPSHEAVNFTQETLFQSSQLVSDYSIQTSNNLNSTCDQQQRNTPSFENELNLGNASSLEDETNLIIENIPHSIDEEGLRSLISQFGDIKQLILKNIGTSYKAELSIELEDPVWIIECLNGTHPFGVSGGKELKCYLKN